MSEATGSYPGLAVDMTGASLVSKAGGTLLTETIRTAGLDRALSAALAPWRLDTAVHDPARMALDLAVALALGGNCLGDAARQAERLLTGGVEPDGVAGARSPRRRAGGGAARDQNRPGHSRSRTWSLAGGQATDRGIDAGLPW